MAAKAGEDEKRFKIVCLIGLTGSGKSKTGNSLCGEKRFKVSCGTESKTAAANGVLTRWFN